MSNKWGRIAVAGVAVAATGALAVGGVLFFTPATADSTEPALVVSSYTTETVTTADYLTAARNDKAARVEAARVAAEAEAARVAAEAAAAAQAAADEAARVAAEQAAAEADTWEEPSGDETAGVPEPETPSLIPLPWVDLGNGTGYWDTSGCPTGSGMTGPDGGQYCYTG
ncbi:hypothetical protein [Agromyces sp. CF514]|uniref:hypothetical protein n=1 Tax=Agromyces sp. CF514 TaxID=1881031 RepID=UPI001160913F|nr:hypothetical protein [Agromyces sp. CF514]